MIMEMKLKDGERGYLSKPPANILFYFIICAGILDE